MGDMVSVEIHDEGWTGGIVELTGDAEPLTIDFGGEDLLAPSAVSTGYLNLVDEGNLEGIMPRNDYERRVVVRTIPSADASGTGDSSTSGNALGTVAWQGWIQANQFGRHMYLRNEVVQFALNDVMQTLESRLMDNTRSWRIERLGELIREAMDAVGAEWSRVVFPKEWSSGNNDWGAWLDIQVSRLNWFRKNEDDENTDDPDYTKYERISYKELLEGIASLMGWTVVVQGTELWFVSYKTEEYVSVSSDSIIFTSGEPLGTGALTSGNTLGTVVGAWALADMTHDDLDNIRTNDSGYHQVSVKASVNPVDSTEVKVDVNGLPYVRLKEFNNASIYNKARTLIYESKQENLLLRSWGIWREANNKGEIDTAWWYNAGSDSAGSHDGAIIVQAVRADIYDSREVTEGKKIVYTYQDGIAIIPNIPTYAFPGGGTAFIDWDNGGNNPVPVVELRGVDLPPQNDGCFDLTFNVDAVGGNHNGKMKIEVRVGDKWWTGYGWTNRQSLVEVDIREGHIIVTKTLDQLYDDASHYVIPINELISGEVRLTLYAGSRLFLQSDTMVLISGLSLRYCNPETVTQVEKKDYNRYVSSVDNGYSEKKEVELMMTTKTDGCKNGFGILYYNGSMLTGSTLRYHGESMIPEKALLKRMKECYMRSLYVAEPSLRMDSLPMIGERVTWEGRLWMVSGYSASIRDNSVKIRMIGL